MILPLDDNDYKEIEKLVRTAVIRSKQHVYAEFEDVVQEAMLFLFRNLKYYNPEKGKMSTFVYINVKKSIFNQVIHHNALKRKKNQFLISLDVQLPSGSFAYDFIKGTTNVEDEVLFNSLMSSLSPIEQDVVKWWMLDLPWKEFRSKYNMNGDKLLRMKNKLKVKIKEILFFQ